MQKTLLVVGNGMATTRFLEELIPQNNGQFRVRVISAEPGPAYDRIQLSPLLAKEKKESQIILHPKDWYQDHQIELIENSRVEKLLPKSQKIHLSDDSLMGYDHLVLATGSRSFELNIPGKSLSGIIGFRTLQDVELMQSYANQKKNAIVIGGGLLGLEAAYGLKKLGLEVTIVHLKETLMERQLDARAGEILRDSLIEKGISVRLSSLTTEYRTADGDNVCGIRLADGTELDAELVVVAAGICPNMELARDAGLKTERGIVVNSMMLTSDDKISAIGECSQVDGQTFGLVAPVYKMAKVCARYLSGRIEVDPFVPTSYATRLKVTGVSLFSSGELGSEHGFEEMVFEDYSKGVYKKLLLDSGFLRGAIVLGDSRDAGWYQRLIDQKTDISSFRDSLIFGEAYTQTASGSLVDVSPMDIPDEVEICGCNGVCKGTIVSLIKQRGLVTLEQVRQHTKASASCGSCTDQVQSLLQASSDGIRDQVDLPTGICACTDLNPDQIRLKIREFRYPDMTALMQHLEWKTPEGCKKCRPALNYFLLSELPGIYQDDYQSKHANERVHANIQKDGTFSVVPRMWGGTTSVAELRAIADVAEKFSIPGIKVTGGQRIDLLGVKKSDLGAVWGELGKAGMVSGHAYGKAVRTVKTCVGSEWCRFGVQDSTDLGIALEKMCWGSATPHKVKMGVSGCPRNCAEATIKDFGVVAVESGFEIHLGGNGGMKVRKADLLVKVATKAEVLVYAGAWLQLYRTTAHYLERTAPWLERVGMTWIQEQLVQNKDKREKLHREFLESQKFSQKDPWADCSQTQLRPHL